MYHRPLIECDMMGFTMIALQTKEIPSPKLLPFNKFLPYGQIFPQIHYGLVDSNIESIKAKEAFSPQFYITFTSDQLITPNTLVTNYADDKVIISTSADPFIASTNLQNHLSLMEDWYKKMRFKVN